MGLIAYFQGQFVPIEKAQVSVCDRGFIFGDGVYELIPVYNGRVFYLQAHCERLQRSLEGIQLPLDLSDLDIAGIAEKLVQHNRAELGDNQELYIQITRGVQEPRSHAFPDASSLNPTVFMRTSLLSRHSAEVIARGFSLISSEDTRWKYCHIKSISLLPNVLLSQKAVAAKATDVVLHRNGWVLECASSNIFMVSSGQLITPPLGEDILGGITRQVVLSLAREHGIAVMEQPIPLETLFQAEEVWITSSKREIYPIVRIDGKLVGTGVPGPLWQRLYTLYDAHKKSLHKQY